MSGPRRMDLRGLPPEEVDLQPVLEHLRAGGLLAYPTETVYGFGCLLRPHPLERLRALKERRPDRPFLLLVPDRHTADGLAWTPEAAELAEVFWPGSVTLLLADPRRRYPAGVRSPEGAVAVRQTSHELARRLVEALGEPLTSTSANEPGGEPAADGEEALRAGRALGADDDLLVLDVGGLPPSAPSTIVDCSGETPRVLRAGATPVDRLRCVLPGIHGR